MAAGSTNLSDRVPESRIREANARPARPDGDFVLYWMIAARRVRWNFGLERAVEWSRHLRRPLLVLEALRSGYPWASDRFHAFVLRGMADNARDFRGSKARYYAYVEPEPGAGSGLLATLARRACVVVTDEFPAFFLPRMVASAARRLPVRLEAVDGNGLLPLRAADRAYPTAHAFRRFLQNALPRHLGDFPLPSPLSRLRQGPPSVPREVTRRWPPVSASLLAAEPRALGALPIDHSVAPAPAAGGSRAARRRLRRFLARGLARYAERNHPDEQATSGLSPYLHFGHLASHEIFSAVMRAEGWTRLDLARKATGSRSGWWGVGEAAEAFLDQLVTWRELGFNTCAHRPDYDRFESLPGWALETLSEHAADPRPETYPLARLAAARTADPIWNAAQTELLEEGTMHNYLRMLWGKKILEWSSGPREALDAMIDLNNRYALDGRDPNSYSGIFWVLGRYDRAWGPERPIFGKIRYMTSASAARKLRLKGYLRRHAPPAGEKEVRS